MTKRNKTYKIDLSTIAVENDIIEQLIGKLNFPDLYTKSWHGFEEHLFYDSMKSMPEKLIVQGMNIFKKRYPDSARNLKKCFENYINDNPNRIVIFEDC